MLKTVDLALKVLMQFNNEKKKWTVNELANHFNENITKIYRICVTLENNNFLIRDEETKEYRLGLAISYLSSDLDYAKILKELVHPYLISLSEKTNESTFFTLKKGDQGFILDSCESNNAIRFAVKVGSSAPLYAGATYRAILAFMDEEEINQILSKKLEKFTQYSKVTKEEILESLMEIKENKFALSQGELTPDVVAIAVPIIQDGVVLASLTVAGPSYRINKIKIREITDDLFKIQKELQDNINFGRFLL